MTLYQSDLCELLDTIRAGGDIDVIRQSVELVLQALIEAEADREIGAGPLRAQRRPAPSSATAPVTDALDQGRRHRAEDPQAP